MQTVDCFLDELTELSRTSSNRQPFYELLVNRLQQVTDAASATVWLSVEQDCLSAVEAKRNNDPNHVPFNLEPIEFARTLEIDSTRLLEFNGQPVIVAAVQGAVETAKVISIHCPDSESRLLRVYQDLLDAVTDIALSFERRMAIEQQRSKFEKLEKLLDLHRNSNSTLELENASVHICNDCRSFLNADRIWLFANHGRANLLACSSVTNVNRRSKSVRQLTKLVDGSLRNGQTLVATNEQRSHEDTNLEQYLASEQIRHLRIQLLKDENQNVTGAIVVEFRQTTDPLSFNESLKFILPTVQTAFNNANRYSQLPFRRTLDRLSWVTAQFRSRRILRTVIVLLLVATAISSLFWIKDDFQIQVSGELRPIIERHIFAPADAIVRSVDVEYGQPVRAGQVVAQLVSKEYQLKINELQNELSAANKKLETDKLLRSQATKQGRDSVYVGQLSAEIEQDLLRIQSVNENIQWFLDNRSELTLQSPIEGQVITRDPRLKLLNRPVVSGNRLLTVADTEAQWQIVFEVPDREFGYFLQAKQDKDVDQWHVEYRLKSDLESVFSGLVSSTDQNNSFDESGNSFVRVFVPVEKSQFNQLRVGQSVDGKIDCGRKTLFYIWTRDIRDFLRTHFFWM